ncbi:MAG: 30S ribosomal protein S6 [Propionibacteriaceae bacterium]|jgi:small subunit ribosomal protein S6|nr:30S ribosomal protein S6 [Propionibacteriaceae bacterium]
MRSYEVMIILDPEVDDRQVQGIIDNHLKPVTKAGGVVTSTTIMGRKRFAYEIKKKAEGTYVVVNLEADPAVVKEFDRRLSIDEKVLRAKVFRPDGN